MLVFNPNNEMRLPLFLVLLMIFKNGISQPSIIPQQQYLFLKLKVLDTNTGQTLNGTLLRVYTRSKAQWIDSSIVKNGFVNFRLEKGQNYDIVGQLNGYLTVRINFNAACGQQEANKVFCASGITIENINRLPDNNNSVEASLSLKQVNLNEILSVEHINYDFDKWEIRRDAWEELNKLVQLLKDNPTIKIELGSHTDSRADETYNMILSQKRAEEAVKYLINRGGISKERLFAKGYGETQLLNQCKDFIPCSEKQHAINRRTEIKIVGYKVGQSQGIQRRGIPISGARN